MIGCHPEMGRAVFEHREHRSRDRPRRADLDPGVVGVTGTRGKELAEELVGAVDEVDLHPASLSQVTDTTRRSRDRDVARRRGVTRCEHDPVVAHVQLEEKLLHTREDADRAEHVEADEHGRDPFEILHVAEGPLPGHHDDGYGGDVQRRGAARERVRG